MHLTTLIALSLPFLPSILSHPVVDGAEAPSRVIQRRQYESLTAEVTGIGGTSPTGTSDPFPTGTGNPFPTGTGEPFATGTGEPFATGTGEPFATGTGTGSLGQKSSLKLMEGGGLLAACASASLGDLSGSTATASAGLTLPTGTTEKRHTHPAQFSPQDFARICAMVEKYNQHSTAGTQTLSTTGDTTDDTTGETTGTASATLPTSTTEASGVSEKKMKRANGW